MIQCHKNHVKLRLVGSIFLFSLCFCFSGFSLHMLCLNLGVAAWAPVLPRLSLGSSASAPGSASKKCLDYITGWHTFWLCSFLCIQGVCSVVVCSLRSWMLSYSQLAVRSYCALMISFLLMSSWYLTVHALCGVISCLNQIMKDAVGLNMFNSYWRGFNECFTLTVIKWFNLCKVYVHSDNSNFVKIFLQWKL